MINRLLQTIEEMEQVEVNLRRAKIKAQKLWRALDPTVSPISQLPDDILLLIFEHGAIEEISSLYRRIEILDADDHSRKSTAHDLESTPRLSFPFLVSHICSFWRAIATSRSSLWTAVHPSWPVEQIQSVLTRSKNYPLHLDLTHLAGKSRLPSHALELLQSVRHRWGSLFLHLEHPEWDEWDQALVNLYTKFIFGESSNTTPILPALKVLYISSSAAWLPFQTHSVEFPQLRTLRFHKVAPDILESLVANVRRAQIDISGLFTWNWRGIGLAANIESLTLRSPPDSADEENTLEGGEESITLPRLLHLCVDMTPPRVTESFLKLLRAPALKSLHVSLRTQDRRSKRSLIRFVSFISTAYVSLHLKI